MEEPGEFQSLGSAHYLPLAIAAKVKSLLPGFGTESVLVFDGQVEAFAAVGSALLVIRAYR